MNRILDMFNDFNAKGKSVTEVSKNDNVLIVDGTNMFMRCFAANSAQNDEGLHVGGTIGFLFSMGVAIRMTLPTRVIIVFDGKGGSKKRKGIYEGYKQGRAFKHNLRRESGFENLEDENESMKRQFIRLMDYLTVLPVSVIKMDYIEADDVISYLTQNILKDKISIVSSDKDFLQLINENISVFSPTKKKTYTPENFKEEYKISSRNYIFMKCILGDASDNVPGIKGIGPKTISKKLPFLFEDVAYSLDMFLDKIVELNNNNKDTIYQKLLDAKDEIIRNYELMQLNDVDISGDKKTIIRNIANEDISKLNVPEFFTMCKFDLLSSVIKFPIQWVQDNFNKIELFRTR